MIKKTKRWNTEEEKGENTQIVVSANDLMDESEDITIEANKIYFYSEVDRKHVLELNKKIISLNVEMPALFKSFGLKESAHIDLHISSYGGSLMDGLNAVDYIRKSTIPIHTYIDGYAASAATLMSIAGKKRYIQKNSFMLIHQLSSGVVGKFSEMKDEMESNELLMKLIVELYQSHTKLPKKKLSEMLKHDLWFPADKCLEYGLVDEII